MGDNSQSDGSTTTVHCALSANVVAFVTRKSGTQSPRRKHEEHNARILAK